MKIMTVFGTRPEAIKMAPLVKALEQNFEFDVRVCVTAQHRQMLDQVLDLFEFDVRVCVTAQHRQMLDQVLDLFSIRPDHDLDLMQPSQSLNALTGCILSGLETVFARDRPDAVLVHGDTVTTLAATIASYYAQIPVGHVEAGLRTGNIYSPWPEEGNRRITSTLARWHFVPTETARNNLLVENIASEAITLTGNTVIDTLLEVTRRIASDADLGRSLAERFNFLDPDRQVVLITGHRRENFGHGFEQLCDGIARLAKRFDRIMFVYPVHLNPNVRDPVNRLLGNAPNIHLIEPLEYLPFVYLMQRSTVILTDSGGIQEEAPALGKPVLVMRDTTERPEAVQAGTVKLVGTDSDRIFQECSRLLTDKAAYDAMAQAINPYGDGQASRRIIARLLEDARL